MNAYKHVSKQLACLRKKQQILLKGMLCVLHSVHWAKILKYIFIFTAKRFRKFVLNIVILFSNDTGLSGHNK